MIRRVAFCLPPHVLYLNELPIRGHLPRRYRTSVQESSHSYKTQRAILAVRHLLLRLTLPLRIKRAAGTGKDSYIDRRRSFN